VLNSLLPVKQVPIQTNQGQLASSIYIRVFQFTFWGAFGFYAPFLNVYFRSIGLSGMQIGMIGTLGAFVAGAGAFAWGLLHDRLGKSRLIFTGICWGTMLLSALIPYLSSYAAILIVFALLSFFSGPMVSQADSMTLKLLGPRHEHYGSHRVWGTIGFVITSALAGFLLEATSIRSIFVSFPLGLLVFWLVTLRLPDQTIHQGPSLFTGLGKMAQNPNWVLLMSSVFVLWAGVLGGYAFLGIAMKDLGSTAASVGLVSTVAALAEIPLLQGGPYILRRFGPNRLLLTAMAIYVVRMLLYAFMVSPEMMIAISLLQSITYCPFLIGAVALANDYAPAELKSTSQGLLGMVMSLANVVGGLAGGWLYDNSGQTGLFLAAASTSAAAFLIFSASTLRTRTAAVFQRQK
jgi:PPP family 3-phenylpropionic acid transporter